MNAWPMVRQVVSGLVKHIPEAEMLGRHVVCVCNMKAANMRGVRSAAMVLAASLPGDAKVRRRAFGLADRRTDRPCGEVEGSQRQGAGVVPDPLRPCGASLRAARGQRWLICLAATQAPPSPPTSA
jgi:tRNA-binding EMAP/Myf-like protein